MYVWWIFFSTNLHWNLNEFYASYSLYFLTLWILYYGYTYHILEQILNTHHHGSWKSLYLVYLFHSNATAKQERCISQRQLKKWERGCFKKWGMKAKWISCGFTRVSEGGMYKVSIRNRQWRRNNFCHAKNYRFLAKIKQFLLVIDVFASKKSKVIPVTLWRPIGLWDVKVPTFFLDSWFTDSGEVVSLVRRPPFTPRKIPGTHFC
jgi:hypothetical protein